MESSSLRTLKIIPRSLNEIVRWWVRFQRILFLVWSHFWSGGKYLQWTVFPRVGGGGGGGWYTAEVGTPYSASSLSLCLLLRGGLFNLCSPTLIIVMNMIMYHTEDSNSCEVDLSMNIVIDYNLASCFNHEMVWAFLTNMHWSGALERFPGWFFCVAPSFFFIEIQNFLIFVPTMAS